MFTPEMIETIRFTQCHTCGSQLLESDKFCRRCGVSQRLTNYSSTVAAGKTDKSEFGTKPLLAGKNPSGSFSGKLVNFVTQSVSEETSSLRANRWTMRLVGALVIVPLWLMIALLSPLDAYVAAKAIAKLGGQPC